MRKTTQIDDIADWHRCRSLKPRKMAYVGLCLK